MASVTFLIRQRLAGTDIYYGWFIAVACLVISAVSFGTIFSFGIFFSHLAAEFQRSYASTSVIFGLQAIVTYVGAAFLGFAIDRYGVRPLLVVAAGLMGAGLLGASQLRSFLGIIVAYSIIAASGLAITVVISYVTAPRWFDRRRGLAVGMATSGTNIGVLAFPPFVSFLIAQYGWRNAYLVMMILIVSALLLSALIIADRPVDLGVDTADEFPDGVPEEATVSVSEQLKTVLDVAASRSFLLVFVGWVLIYTPLFVLLVYLVEYTTTAGVGRNVGVFAVSTIGASAFVSRYLAGSASDRWGTLKTFTVTSIALGGAALLIGLFQQPIAIYGFAILFGFGYGGTGTLLSPLLVDLYGSLNLGAIFGIAIVSFAIAGSGMTYLAGVGYDLFGTFSTVFVIAGTAGVVGGILTVAVSYRVLSHKRVRA